jgi:hypothetical protein
MAGLSWFVFGVVGGWSAVYALLTLEEPFPCVRTR